MSAGQWIPPGANVVLNALSAATVGANYSASLGVVYRENAVLTGVTWQLTDTGTLPPGAAVSTAGVLTANFSTSGSYSCEVTINVPQSGLYFAEIITRTIHVTAVDSGGGTGRTINVALNAVPSAQVNVPYATSLGSASVTGTTPPTPTWSVKSAGNLPAGYSLSTSGLLSATFGDAGAVNFVVTISATGAAPVDKNITVNVINTNVTPVITVNMASNPAANTGVAYATSVGAATVTVADAGNLPGGYSFSTAGLLSATFTDAGTVTFVAQIAATGAVSIQRTVTVNVVSSGGGSGNPTPPAAPTIPPATTLVPAPPPPPPEPPPPPPPIFQTVEETGTQLLLVTHVLNDDGLGNLNPTEGSTGTVNYDTGVLYFPPEIAGVSNAWSSASTNGTGEWTSARTTDVFSDGAQITVSYRPDSVSPTDAEETLPAQNILLDLAPYTADFILPGSVEFQIGSTIYQDNEGEIWHTVNPNTGAGTPAGTIDYGNGRVTLTNWVAGSSTFTLLSLATFRGQHTDTEMTFRTAGSPLRPSGLQLACTAVDGELLTGTTNVDAELVGDALEGAVDLTFGLIDVRFGETVLDEDLTEAEKLEEWYDAGDVDEDGYIWKPRTVTPSTVRYNAVMYAYLPLSADLIGLDPVRLPSDGRVPIFRPGQLALIHHTDAFTESSLSPTQVLDCGRLRLYRVVIEDVDQQRLPASFFVVNRELGTVTMASDLNLTGYTAPYTIYHTVADLSLVTNSEITGEITFNKACSHAYPIDDTYPSYVSNVLYAGTLQARYSNLFAQSTWTSVWSDILIGSAPLAQYNDTLYPLTVSNLGAYTDRMLIKFTSSTAFQVIGENLGLIATGTINEDCAPVNSLTGQPYFTIDYRGWGAGWATGNCVRFNLIGANTPVDLIRAVQPSNPTGADDSVELLFVGNVDA
jgi:hypothetical protein